jgi:2'-5' RNA ligase
LQRLASVLESVKVGDLGAVRVDAVHLYQSDLRPGGPIYTRLYSARMSVPV